jgi:multiple sugar transport system substrate-binding protein
VVILSGCSEKAEAVKKVEKVTHWSWSNGGYITYVWDAFKGKYPEYADVEFIFVSQGGSSQAMMQQIMLSYAAGAEIPDTIDMNFKLNPMLVESGVTADITEFIAPYKNKVPEFVWNAAMHDGRMYGIPMRGNGTMLFYREDLCLPAGIDVTKIKTWDDYFVAGEKFRAYYKAQGKDIYFATVPADKPADYLGEMIFSQLGIGYFDENGECILDTDPQAIEAIKTIYRLHETGIAAKLLDLTPSWYGALGEGSVGTFLTAGWMPSIMMNNVPAGAGLWRIAPWPVFSNGKQGMQGVTGITILSKDKAVQELTCRVITETSFDDTAVYETEAATLYNFSMNIFKTKYLNDDERIIKQNNYFGGQNVKELDMEILDNALLLKYTPHFTEVLSIMSTEISRAMSGQKSIDQAISDMGETVRQQIGTSKY